jgi:hypothetical protein
MKKGKECLRCESVGKVPRLGTVPMIGPNGIRTQICQKCYDELKEEGEIHFANETHKSIS